MIASTEGGTSVILIGTRVTSTLDDENWTTVVFYSTESTNNWERIPEISEAEYIKLDCPDLPREPRVRNDLLSRPCRSDRVRHRQPRMSPRRIHRSSAKG